MRFHNYNGPSTSVNYLGNDGTQCGVINRLNTKQVALFGKLRKIQLSAGPAGAELSQKDQT